MSLRVDSWESILSLASVYYHSRLSTEYDVEYLRILQNVVGDLLGTTRYKYIETSVPLLEPIVRHKGVVYFSLPLIAYCLNQSPVRPRNAIAAEKAGFDLFDRALDDIDDASSTRASIVCRRLLDLRKSSDNARFSILARIVLMARHWRQHDSRRQAYDDHREFRDAERALDDNVFAAAVEARRAAAPTSSSSSDAEDY